MARSAARGWFVLVLLGVILAAVAGRLYVRLAAGPGGAAGVSPGGQEGGLPGSPPGPSGGGKATLELYFSSLEGTHLVPERREVPGAADTLERCRLVLQELKKGPRGQLAGLVPMEMETRALYLADKVLVVDLQPTVLQARAGALQEALLWYSVVDSVIMNAKDVAAVQFLVEGRETDAIQGHLDLRGPVTERLDLVKWY